MNRFAARPLTLLLRSLASLVLAVLLCGLAAGARAQDQTVRYGVALVIGQSDYASLDRLANPENDADLMAETLEQLGFDVTKRTNRSAVQLNRDLRRFAEDAAEADVAVLYYSGHGVEAGGENWLLPVDTPSEADAAGLVAISPVIAGISEQVPLTIAFLDACRTSPFLPGATLQSQDRELSLSAGGLSPPRGAFRLEADTGTGDHVGTVLGFSAAPGRVAFDGPPGETSYYAAALSKHLGASDAREFGVVMKLVTEEVFLKTNRRQRPWVNESLNRLLYFGGSGPAVEPGERMILEERRKLLLTISDLDQGIRTQVASFANAEAVPMDAVFGLLNVLDGNLPDDPAELEELLRSQARKLKAIQDRDTVLTSQDPEIQALLTLAQKALAEGALAANTHFLEQAASKQQAIDTVLDDAEARLRARRLESARVKASLANAYQLEGRNLQAAKEYRSAYETVEKWDPALGRLYRREQADALSQHGRAAVDRDALRASVELYTLLLADPALERGSPEQARVQLGLGRAYRALGYYDTATRPLEQAAAAFTAALSSARMPEARQTWVSAQNGLVATRIELVKRTGGLEDFRAIETDIRFLLDQHADRFPAYDRAELLLNLGDLLARIGQLDTGSDQLQEANRVYRQSLRDLDRAAYPILWARTQVSLALSLSMLGERTLDRSALHEAIAANNAALEVLTRSGSPWSWAGIQNNLSAIYQILGQNEPGTGNLRRAEAQQRAALTVLSDNKASQHWATATIRLADVLRQIAEREPDPATATEATRVARSVLARLDPKGTPATWAEAQTVLGNALLTLGRHTGELEALTAARSAFQEAATYLSRDETPNLWAFNQMHLAQSRLNIGRQTSDEKEIRTAIDAFEAALPVYRRAENPLLWAVIQNNIGTAYQEIGYMASDPEAYELSVAYFRRALEERTQDRTLAEWAITQHNLGVSLFSIAVLRDADLPFFAFLRQGPHPQLATMEEAHAALDAAISARMALGREPDWMALTRDLSNQAKLLLRQWRK